jgi:hypothetical protein
MGWWFCKELKTVDRHEKRARRQLRVLFVSKPVRSLPLVKVGAGEAHHEEDFKSRKRLIVIGTAIKTKIVIPKNIIPSLCPACASKDSAVVLAFGPGVAVGSKSGCALSEDRLRKESETRIKRIAKKRIFFVISNSSKRVIKFHPSISRAKSGNSYQFLTCHV